MSCVINGEITADYLSQTFFNISENVLGLFSVHASCEHQSRPSLVLWCTTEIYVTDYDAEYKF